MSTRRISFVIIVLLAVLFVGGVGTYKYLLSIGPFSENSLDAPPIPHDELYAQSTDIFAVRTAREVSRKNVGSHPEIQYEVEIISMPYGQKQKGNANGVVVISSLRPITISADGYSGEVLYTKYNKFYRWYELIVGSPFEWQPPDLNSIHSYRDSSNNNGKLEQKVIYVDAQYAADFSDDKILMGASHNVFVGKVIRQSGTKERGIGPETQFEVVVIDNIKGDLHGVITVDQQGGYKDGTLYVVGDDTVSPAKDGSGYLLQPGSTYLFATRYNPTEHWYTLNSYPTASKLLSTDAGAQDASLRTLAEADLRVQQLRVAYPNEILMSADVAHNNTLRCHEHRCRDERFCFSSHFNLHDFNAS